LNVESLGVFAKLKKLGVIEWQVAGSVTFDQCCNPVVVGEHRDVPDQMPGKCMECARGEIASDIPKVE
jgi:hypothetical protein